MNPGTHSYKTVKKSLQGQFIFKILTLLCLCHCWKCANAILTREISLTEQNEHSLLAILYLTVSPKYGKLMCKNNQHYFKLLIIVVLWKPRCPLAENIEIQVVFKWTQWFTSIFQDKIHFQGLFQTRLSFSNTFSIPIHVLQYVIHVENLPRAYRIVGIYVHKRTKKLVHV